MSKEYEIPEYLLDRRRQIMQNFQEIKQQFNGNLSENIFMMRQAVQEEHNEIEEDTPLRLDMEKGVFTIEEDDNEES